MLPIVVIFLFLTALAATATFIFMVTTVLVQGPLRSPALVREWRWRPPLATGAELMAWSSGVAESLTRTFFSTKRGKGTPSELVEELLRGATFAINHIPHAGIDQEGRSCASCKHETIGATAPEILAIADRVRGNRGTAHRIHDLAVSNARAAENLAPTDSRRTQLTCPLLTSEGTCASFPVRPLYCRAACPACCKTAGTDQATATLKEVARSVGLGAEQGLTHGIEAAGLDAKRYELNGALAVALETRDASERWTRGEDVFSGCKQSA